MSRDMIAFVEVEIDNKSKKQNSKKLAESVENFLKMYNGNANCVLSISKNFGDTYAIVDFEMRSYYDFKMLDDLRTWAQEKGVVLEHISAIEYVESDDGYYWERENMDADEVCITLNEGKKNGN